MTRAEAVIASNAMAALRIAAPTGTVRSRSARMRMSGHPPERAQDALRRVGLLEDLDAQRGERVIDGVAHGGGRADGAGLADALGTERRAGDRRLHVRDHDVGHL